MEQIDENLGWTVQFQKLRERDVAIHAVDPSRQSALPITEPIPWWPPSRAPRRPAPDGGPEESEPETDKGESDGGDVVVDGWLDVVAGALAAAEDLTHYLRIFATL